MTKTSARAPVSSALHHGGSSTAPVPRHQSRGGHRRCDRHNQRPRETFQLEKQGNRKGDLQATNRRTVQRLQPLELKPSSTPPFKLFTSMMSHLTLAFFAPLLLQSFTPLLSHGISSTWAFNTTRSPFDLSQYQTNQTNCCRPAAR